MAATAVAKRNEAGGQLAAIDSIKTLLWHNKSKIEAALPKHITADRMIRVSLNSLRNNKALLSCTPDSLFNSIVEASTYGWEIGGPVAQAYLVPYGKECTLIPGYRGLMDLARRSGEVENIACGVVHEGDEFHQSDDPLVPMVRHRASNDPDRKSKPITHVWAGYLLRGNQRVYSVMTAAEIDQHKERYAKGWKSKDSAWQTAWDAMALKTVIKRPIMQGLVPIAAEHQRLWNIDEVEGEVVKSEVASIEVPAPQLLEQTPAEEPAEPVTEKSEMLNVVAEKMATCKTLKAVNEIVSELEALYFDIPESGSYIAEIADTRREAIRGSRGEHSNKPEAATA